MSNKFYYQRGGIGAGFIFAAVILGVIGYFYFYPDFSKSPPMNCVLGKAPKEPHQIRLPAVSKTGGQDVSKMVDYVLIRTDVPVNDKKTGFFVPPSLDDNPKMDDAHLWQFPDIPQKPGYDLFYPYSGADGGIFVQERLSLNIINEGFIVFRNKDPKSIKEVPGNGGSKNYHVDMYQEKSVLEEHIKRQGLEGWVADLFGCTIGSKFDVVHDPISLVIPTQHISPDKAELQLGWFYFKSDGTWYVHCKPAIYLYPEQKIKVNVKVHIPQGELLYTDPIYPKGGWNVLAEPSGKLWYLGKNTADSYGKINYPDGVFPYLYYEGRVVDEAIEKPTTGYIRKYKELDSFFDELLPQLGLNQKESKEFKDYWLKALPKVSYYFIGIVSQENLDEIEPLTITPKQDTIIRVGLYFEALKESRSVKAPELERPERNGFTVIEWGGMLKRDKDHPFTCVQ